MRAFLLPLSLVALTLVAFVNSIPHPFVHDDIVFIVQNPQISRLDNLPQVFLPVASLHPQGINTYYRPVLEVVYRLEYNIFGFNAHGFHLVNVLLHVGNGLLLFGLLQRLGLTALMAWLVSLFFLIHPVQSEAVACVAGISNLLMVSLVLLTLHAYLRGWLIAAVATFAIALLTKEQALMVPLLIILLDIRRHPECHFEPNGRIISTRTTYCNWLIFVGIALLSMMWRQMVTGASVLKDISQSPGELILRVKAIAQVLVTDIRLVFAPYDLHYYRSTDILSSSLNWWLILFALLLALSLFLYRRKDLRWAFLLGGGWFILSLAPVLNIVPLINEYSLILTSEHFLYLPIIGILIVIASVILSAAKNLKQVYLWIIISLLAAVCLFLTIRQNTYWRDEVTLFERAIQFEPKFSRGQLLLAKAYYFNGRLDDADLHFAKAYEIMLSYASRTHDKGAKAFYQGFMKGILFDWAHVDEAKGRWREALIKYKQAITIDEHDATLFNNAGACLLQINEPLKAKKMFVQALSINPDFEPARKNLAQITLPEAVR